MKNIEVLIVKFLRDQLESGKLTPEATEGVEVAIQCIQEAFQISEEELQTCNESLNDICNRQSAPKELTSGQREEAENLKQVGNSLMKENKFKEAITNYTRAIEIDPNNAVYYCNRAAANIKLGVYGAAIEDCNQALRIDPRYSKAHSRLGFAYSAIGNNAQAKSCYQKALEIEPENESYKTCLRDIEAHLGSSGAAPFAEIANMLPNMDLSGLLNNPRFVDLMGDPGIQRLVEGVFGMSSGGNVQDLISLGQQLTSRLQQATANPAQNASNEQGDGSNGFPDLIRPQEGDAAPTSQGQSADPQQQEIKPDVVQQTVEENLSDSRNVAPPTSASSVPRGAPSMAQGDVLNQNNSGNNEHLRQ
ncbi:hypothetical protein J437_LFUL013150 [Ladona fulva]|uniref:SGTA homodimerisation domain-containing protein n=1 Tax=Ladona fulva TaxID=123851 RepID=A0A8K0KID3_LADFU|nr:hypothetical protein J437_LFUL013150 [Ladona fulva]